MSVAGAGECAHRRHACKRFQIKALPGPPMADLARNLEQPCITLPITSVHCLMTTFHQFVEKYTQRRFLADSRSDDNRGRDCDRPSFLATRRAERGLLFTPEACAKLGYDLPVLRSAEGTPCVSGAQPDHLFGVLRDQASRRDRLPRRLLSPGYLPRASCGTGEAPAGARRSPAFSVDSPSQRAAASAVLSLSHRHCPAHAARVHSTR
jgi:hypothetical protein